ncbi:MAG: hypothetical protein WEB00_09255 [Dehalococcoidia bacterium]
MTIERGILRAFDSAGWKASVQFHGSLSRRVSDIRVNRGLDPAQLQVGRFVAVAFFEDRNPRDAVVLGVWVP